MAYEQTSVPVGKSQEAIRKLVLQHGGTGIAFISQPPVEGFEAQVPIEGVLHRIRLQAECKSDGKAHHRRGVALDPFEQDCRRIWRVLYHHLKGIYEAQRTGVLEFRRMILAYIVTSNGKTVGDHLLPDLERAIEGHTEQLLLPAAGG